MVKSSSITLPNGVKIEISPDFTPLQINAIISSVMGGSKLPQEHNDKTKDEYKITADEMWYSSKKDKLTLFIRNYFSDLLWFTAKEVLEQQLLLARVILFGESAQISTYLKRMYEEKLLIRQQYGHKVKYRGTEKLYSIIPVITEDRFQELIKESINQ